MSFFKEVKTTIIDSIKNKLNNKPKMPTDSVVEDSPLSTEIITFSFCGMYPSTLNPNLGNEDLEKNILKIFRCFIINCIFINKSTSVPCVICRIISLKIYPIHNRAF